MQANKPTKYMSCITCKESLHYKPLQDWIGSVTHDVPYCPNSKCVRYGLFTLEDDELLEDSVKGFTEKEASNEQANN